MMTRLPSLRVSRFLLPALLMLTLLLLSACGDKEPQQRQAFITFLQTHVLAQSQLTVPALSDEQKQAFGRYASDYALLASWHQEMHAVLNRSVGPVFSSLSHIGSIDSLVSRRDEMQRMADLSAGWMPALVKLRRSTDQQHAALNQPADVKAVYDQAYRKLIIQPDAVAMRVSSLVPQVLSLVIRQIDLLRQQGINVQLDGNRVHFNDPQALERYNALQLQLQPLTTALSQAAGQLQQIMR